MPYLAILVVVAVAGLTRLWLLHRRELRNTRVDFHGLRARLERVADSGPLHERGDPPARARWGSARLHRPEPLEPSRREAAKRRIEARRSARASSG
jgi:hypothetical protein